MTGGDDITKHGNQPKYLTTIINVANIQAFALGMSSLRAFSTLVLRLIVRDWLLDLFGCRNSVPETEKCDELLLDCHETSRPIMCIEGKYVENFWLKRSHLRQQLEHVRKKLQSKIPIDHVVVSSFAYQALRDDDSQDSSPVLEDQGELTRDEDSGTHHRDLNLYIRRHRHVLVVILVDAKAVETSVEEVTREIRELGNRVVVEEQLEPITNIHGHILYEEQQLLREGIDVLRQQQARIEERQERIEERQARMEERQERMEKKLDQVLELLLKSRKDD